MSMLQNEDFKTLAQLTGAGGTSSQLLNDTKIYMTGAAKQLSAAITAGDIQGVPSVSSAQTIAGGGTITVSSTNAVQVIPVAGSSGAQTLSTTPFGTGAVIDGTVIEIIGTDDTNTISITYNDASNGCVGPFSTITLAKYERARFVRVNSLGRYIGGKL